jgi:hypothetical protein
MNIGVVFLVIAVILFAIGAWSRWWGTAADPRGPYFGSFLCAGLFFWALSQLYPLLSR